MLLKRSVITFVSAISAAILLACTATRPAQTGSAPTAAIGERTDLRSIYSEIGRTGGRVFTLLTFR